MVLRHLDPRLAPRMTRAVGTSPNRSLFVTAEDDGVLWKRERRTAPYPSFPRTWESMVRRYMDPRLAPRMARAVGASSNRSLFATAEDDEVL